MKKNDDFGLGASDVRMIEILGATILTQDLAACLGVTEEVVFEILKRRGIEPPAVDELEGACEKLPPVIERGGMRLFRLRPGRKTRGGGEPGTP